MNASSSPEQHPSSAIQKFLSHHPFSSNSPYPDYVHQLALQVAHNLHFQHSWTHVRLHTSQPSLESDSRGYPRPMLSGLPPQRLYVHPDEQITLLQQHKDAGGKLNPLELPSEREWVLPTHLRETWSPRRLAEVFDSLTVEPPPMEDSDSGISSSGELLFSSSVAAEPSGSNGTREKNPWRTTAPKRLLLATVDSDSTVVYYIVHDGIVKPRQN